MGRPRIFIDRDLSPTDLIEQMEKGESKPSRRAAK